MGDFSIAGVVTSAQGEVKVYDRHGVTVRIRCVDTRENATAMPQIDSFIRIDVAANAMTTAEKLESAVPDPQRPGQYIGVGNIPNRAWTVWTNDGTKAMRVIMSTLTKDGKIMWAFFEIGSSSLINISIL